MSSPAIERSDVGADAAISVECADDLLSIDGRPVGLSFSTTPASLLAGEPIAAEVCDAPLQFGVGGHRVVGSNTTAAGALSAMTVDRIVLRDVSDAVIDSVAPRSPSSPNATIPGREPSPSRPVPTVAGSCSARGTTTRGRHRSGGDDLGAPELIDGGFNGWWLAPSEQPVTVDIRWTAQAPVTWGLTIGVVSSLLLVLVIALSRRLPRRSSLHPSCSAPVEAERAEFPPRPS